MSCQKSVCPRESLLGFALQVHTGIRSQPAFPALPWGRCCQGIRAAFDPIRDPLLVWEGDMDWFLRRTRKKRKFTCCLLQKSCFISVRGVIPTFLSLLLLGARRDTAFRPRTRWEGTPGFLSQEMDFSWVYGFLLAFRRKDWTAKGGPKEQQLPCASGMILLGKPRQTHDAAGVTFPGSPGNPAGFSAG